MAKLKIATFRYTDRRRVGEGLRLGTTRFLPRGVRRDDYVALDYFDVWFPLLAPSKELLAWAKTTGLGVSDPEWQRKYRKQLAKTDARQALRLLAQLAKTTPISIGCYCADERFCHRSVLRRILHETAADTVVRRSATRATRVTRL
jgi:uncharacterized protein YeaO (DUF488 family)